MLSSRTRNALTTAAVALTALGCVTIPEAQAATPAAAPTRTESSHTAQQSPYRRYRNARFRFSFDIPRSYRSQHPPEDGDGLSWRGASGKAKVIAAAENNVIGDTPRSVLAQCVHDLHAHGGHVTYRYRHGSVVICSGINRGVIVYERAVVYPQVEYYLEWSYARSVASRVKQPLERSVTSYRPGPRHGD